jgi:hypothetical protein
MVFLSPFGVDLVNFDSMSK